MKAKKLILMALFMIILVVMLPICFAESICGEEAAAEAPAEEMTEMNCEEQEDQDLQAIANIESGWLPKIPLYIAIIMIIVLIVIAVLTFGSTVPAIGILTGTVAFGLSGIGLTVATVGFIASSYLAYQGFKNFENIDKTDTFAADCDTEIKITKKPEGDYKNPKCILTDTSNGEQKEVNDGDTYEATAGNSYTLTASVELEDWGKKAKCTCTATGKIVSHSSTDDPTTPPEPAAPVEPPASEAGAGSEVLVCCRTADGICLENYVEGTCTSAGGTVFCTSCSEVESCKNESALPTAIGEGSLQITDLDGNTISSIKEGQNILIKYHLPDATKQTKVIAHIKIDGKLADILELFDDGNHKDEGKEDKTYANTLSTNNILKGKNAGKLSVDIEVIAYKENCSGDDCIVYQNLFSDQGSLIVTSASIDCDPLGSFATNKTLDVILVGNNYHDATIQKQELSAAAGIIALTEPFLSYYANPSQGINFYTINKLFETDDIQQIRTYAYSNCVYSSAFQKLVIILDKKNFECAQEEYTVRLNSPFSFNTTKASETTINEIVSDFCSYVNQLALMNPPVATILTQDMVTAPQQIPIDFKITDEEYPVDYELLFNYVTLIKSRVSDANVHQHVLNIPQGNWILQIKATDKRGNEGYSNILRIMTNDTITVDFSSLGTVSIPKGSSVNINLNSYADDPRNENIIEWVHEPAFSNCVEFNPVARITSGSVSLIATGNTGCQETIKFEVITASNRRGSGTMNIRVE